MIIKSFLNKIKIDKITLIFIFICFITGLIKELLSIMILISIHELGHLLFSYIFKWNISKIIIYPFGGLIKYDDIIDKPLYEEFIITIMGPLFQIIIYLIFYYLHKNYYIEDYFFNILKSYHYGILIFNLIPIIPLDGSKILNILLNKLFSFRVSYILLLIISIIISILGIFLLINNYSYIFVLSFIITEIIFYIKNKNIIFNRFIYEKYLYDNKYKNIMKIDNLNRMKRNKKHLIRINNIYYSEKSAIKKIKGV